MCTHTATHAYMYNINDKLYVEMLRGGIYTLMHVRTLTLKHTHTHAAHLYTKSLELCRNQTLHCFS